jgi:hypothetical protein
MIDGETLALAPIFASIGEKLAEKRAYFNQIDDLNGNHGDHMVAIFDTATRAVDQKSGQFLSEGLQTGGQELAGLMDYAGGELARLENNDSAQVYARGLACVAKQLGQREITLKELADYAAAALSGGEGKKVARSGEVLKALVAGIAAWNRLETGAPEQDSALNMGALFDFGIAYMGAKGRGGSRIDVIADAAASVSPLGKVPYRLESGKLAISALLRALESGADGLSQSE